MEGRQVSDEANIWGIEIELAPGIQQTLDHLGESPEAWRGAITVIDSLMELFGQTLRTIEQISEEEGGVITERKVSALGLITVTVISTMAREERVEFMRDLLDKQAGDLES